MNGIEALKKVRVLAGQGKAFTFTVGSTGFNSTGSSATSVIVEALADNPDEVFSVTEMPTVINKELLAQVWDKTRPASSPAASENKFFAKIIAELTALGLL